MSRMGNRDFIDRDSYAVGFGKPPVHSRFKAGVSGNPMGRPRGSRNPPAVVYAIVNEKITVRLGDKVQRVSKFEAMMHNVAAKALKGDSKSIKTILDLTMSYSSVINPPKNDVMEIFLVDSDGSQKPLGEPSPTLSQAKEDG